MHNLHPGLILMATGILVLLIPKKEWRNWLAVGGSAISLAAVILLSPEAKLTYAFTSRITMEFLDVDPLSRIFGLIFCIISVIAGIYSLGTESRTEKCASMVYAGSSLGVVFAGDWVTLICFWELMAVASWYLVWGVKTQAARRASYRYLVLHFFGGNLLLVGGILLFSQGQMDVSLLTGLESPAFWLIFFGVAINAAIPPFHAWVPDAYPESTVEGTVYMGSFTTKVAIYVLIRCFAGMEILVLVGAIMAVFAACMAFIENDLRRILSYHIVSQLGMMVAGLGTGLEAGIDGAALQSAFHILYKSVLLMGAGAVVQATGLRKVSDMGGLAKKMPVTAVCFLIASLAIAGMPFLNGFASKALIMESLHDFTAGYWLVIVAGVGTWLSITLKINYFVFFGKSDKDIPCSKVPMYMQIAMMMGTALCIITGVYPYFAYELTPYATMGHPFTAHHIMEYLGLFIGATIPFTLFIKRMAPHDTITLDTDWVYRRWIPNMLTWLSEHVYDFFGRMERIFAECGANITFMVKHPSKVFTETESFAEMREKYEDEPDEGFFEGDLPVGVFMQVFIIFCIVAFLVVLMVE